jgi:glycosyltransferase involved in cell wall biosynthesis
MQSGIKVLHLVKTSVGATWALRQMRELVRLGVEVHAAIPPGGVLNSEYQAAGVIVHPETFDLPIGEPWRWRALFRRLRSLVREVGPGVIHSHFVGTTLAMRLALGKAHGTPRVFQVPGPLHLEHALYRGREIATAGERDYWVGSCRLTCELYRRAGIRADRIFLSYYGFDTERFGKGRRGSLRAEMGVGEDARLVGMVAYMYPPKWYLGQLRGIKGHEDLIEAIAICRRARPETVGVFVGGPWNGAVSYERRVREHGRRRCGDGVRFLGTRADVAQLYPEFDVAVHPSRSENVGGAGESLVSEVPTIATAVGGLPDVVRHGETGWLVPPGRPELLAEAIQDALNDPVSAREKARRGQALVRRLLDVRATAAGMLDIYRNVCRAGV